MLRKLHPAFIFRSISNRIISSQILSTIIYRIFGFKPLSYLLLFSIEKGNWSGKRYSILCIKRDLFDKDITELRKNLIKTNWFVIGTPQLAFIQSAWTPAKLRNQTVFQKYFTEEYEMVWEESEAFAKLFLKLAIRRLNVKAVISANIDYWQDEGLRRACRSMKIPFLVLSKENCIIPKSIKNTVKYYRNLEFKFTGEAIAVFSSKMRNALISSKVCTPDKIFVTGAPRIDAWRSTNSLSFQDSITLLPFGEGNLSDDSSFQEVLDIFLFMARKNRNADLNFLIKCKNNKQKLDLIKRLPRTDIKSICLTVNRPLFDLFPHSRLVIGYNTLALVEALLSKTVIAIPQWGENRGKYDFQQFDPSDRSCQKVIEFLDDTSDLKRLINIVINNQYANIDIEKRINLMKRYLFYDPDRTNSDYVENFVLSHINSKKSIRGYL